MRRLCAELTDLISLFALAYGTLQSSQTGELEQLESAHHSATQLFVMCVFRTGCLLCVSLPLFPLLFCLSLAPFHFSLLAGLLLGLVLMSCHEGLGPAEDPRLLRLLFGRHAAGQGLRDRPDRLNCRRALTAHFTPALISQLHSCSALA
jgi:hypothetical protein